MKDSQIIEIPYYQFVVSQRAFCIWDDDLQKKSLFFLENIDPSYFDYMVEKHFSDICEGEKAKSKDSQHAALALRTIYSQALESFFAFLGSSLQAPFYPSAWINLYSNRELISIIHKISNYEPILSQTRFDLLTWEKISELIFQNLVLTDKQKEIEIKAGFAKLWSSFASDLINQDFSEEYNSIKHGLRVHIGGFYLSIGIEEKPGVPAPPEKMRLIGKSDFGTKYYVVEKIGEDNINLRNKIVSRNWNPEDLAYGIKLLSMSISNVISFLKIVNGEKPERVQFLYPENFEKFEEPWKRSLGIGISSMSTINPLAIPKNTKTNSKEEILENYRKGKNLGTVKFSLP